jgi:hypothetical protein
MHNITQYYGIAKLCLVYLQLDSSDSMPELENDAISLFKKIAKSLTSFLYQYNISDYEDTGDTLHSFFH